MTLLKGIRLIEKLKKQSLSPVPTGRNALSQHSTYCDGWMKSWSFSPFIYFYIFFLLIQTCILLQREKFVQSTFMWPMH